MHKILLALTGAALSAAVVAFPVYANQGPASPARTNTQFRITPGDLTITAPASANLGTGSQSGGIQRRAVPSPWARLPRHVLFTAPLPDTEIPGPLLIRAGSDRPAAARMGPARSQPRRLTGDRGRWPGTARRAGPACREPRRSRSSGRR